MEAGQRVRLKSAPDKIGILTGKERPGRRRRLQVDFQSSKEYILEGNLELVAEDSDIYDMLEKGSYGSLSNLRGAITHSRLTGRLADVIYSMEATNTEFYPYQYKPVLNFLDSTCRGILIADEVGLGKTIEAGLIWTELRARFDASKLLILCPAMLRDKWKAELLHRFGIRSELYNADQLHTLLKEGRAGTRDEFAAICSLQGLRPPTDWHDESNDKKSAALLARFLQENEADDPLFDCVVVDEAHYLRNPESQTHKLATLIRPVAENVILLSATPIQLKSDDLFHLLKILDEENFQFKSAFDEILKANQPIVELSSALRAGALTESEFIKQLNQCISHPMFQGNRQLGHLLEEPPTAAQLKDIEFSERLAARVERINLLARVVTRSRKRDVQKNRVERIPRAITIEMNGIEQEFYTTVTEEVRRYCNQYDLFEGFMLTIPQRQVCSSIPAALRSWQKRIEIDNELVFETAGEELDTRRRKSVGPLVEKLANMTKELASYEQLKASDSKYKELVRSLSDYWRKHQDNKVILFSYYRETLFYLKERLIEDGVEVSLLIGGMKENKQEAIDQFKESSTVKILLSSEVASEGVDLQFSSLLINYDLPWNPMRVEQRIGRIDRIGQKADSILIWNFFYQDTLDDRVYKRLFSRLDIFRYALGDMEAVLGERIRNLTYELLSHDLTPAQEESRIKQTQIAVAADKRQQEELEGEAGQLAAHGDYVLNKVSAAKEMRRYIDGESLWIYIREFVQDNYPGCKLLQISNSPLTIDIDLSHAARADISFYLEKNKALGTTKLSRTSTGDVVTCIFDNNVDFGNRSYEVINQYHPLVRFVASNVQQEIFHPLVSATITSSKLDGIAKGKYLVSARRWSTSGARSIERLVYRGLNISTGRKINENDAEKLISGSILSAEDWIGANNEIDADGVVEGFHQLVDELDDDFDEYCRAMKYENDDRVDYLISTLKNHTNNQIEKIRTTNQEILYSGSDRQKRIIKANEGRIKKLEDYQTTKITQYENKSEINSIPSDVVTGVIHVT